MSFLKPHPPSCQQPWLPSALHRQLKHRLDSLRLLLLLLLCRKEGRQQQACQGCRANCCPQQLQNHVALLPRLLLSRQHLHLVWIDEDMQLLTVPLHVQFAGNTDLKFTGATAS